jgi:hypothetical protein
MSSPIINPDPVTEEKINRKLAKLHCTTIGIAHRLSTIQGSHEELLGLGGCYAALIEAQTIRSPMRDWHNESKFNGASSNGYSATA